MIDYKKYSLIALVAVAVIVAAVAVMVVSSKRAETATALAEKAANETAKAKAEQKMAEANAAAEKAKERTAADTAKTAAENRKAKEAEAAAAAEASKKAEADCKAAAENRKAKEAIAATAHDNRVAEADRKAASEATARAAAEKAKAKKYEEAKAAYVKETERLRSERDMAEVKKLELLKVDFQTWASNLREKERELEDRERALTPEKTIVDLNWAGGMEDSVFDANGNLCKQPKKAPCRVEDDPMLPRSSRQLAKSLRELDEMASNETARVRAAIVTPLEKEYVAARKDDRVLDANYIADAIRLLYPDWKYKGEETKETKGTEETKQDLNMKGNNEANL